MVSRCKRTRFAPYWDGPRGLSLCTVALIFLVLCLATPGLSAHPLILTSTDAGTALLDTVRTDSVVIYEFTSSKRLEREHRDHQFIWDFSTSEGGVPDSLSRGAYQRLLAEPRDSTARIKNLTYQLKDEPQVSIDGPPKYPAIFLQPPAGIMQWSATLDSTGSYVTIRQMMGKYDMRLPLKIPLADYIRLSLEASRRKAIEDQAHAYALKGGKKDDFGELLGSVTKIEIPVPANPVFSIFGKPSISLNISGDVNIKAAYRSITQEQLVTSLLGNTRNEPDFSQVVRLNVDGLIGDKLAIRANWDTQTQFEYENRLSLVYTGYDDEIVKKVEAGNVSMTTPSSFIGSSQALFGIKTTMQFGPLTLTALASQKKGQVQELSVSGGSQNQAFEIHPYQYSTNHYFISSVYRTNYESYYNSTLHQANPLLIINDIEVYKSRYGTTTENGNEKPAIAYLNLTPASSSTLKYDDSMRDSTARQGEIEIGSFVKLDATAYTVERASGILTLNTNVQDGEIIAVAYRTSDGLTYGEFSARADTSKSRVLKLVKPATLVPSMTAAWELLVKNRYPIGGRGLKKDKFDLDILYNTPGQQPTDQLYGQSLLQVFGLDRLNDAGDATPDNKFDFVTGFTIDQDRGELIFPTLEPFRNAIPDWWTKHNVTSDIPADSLTFSAIYDTTLAIAQQSPRDRFTITGSYSSDVNAKYSIGFNVVENSVQVLLDGVPLQPGTDFTVDYNLGEVTIRRDDALVPGKNLQIKYEQNDLFQMASKTIMALRGDLRLGLSTNLGFTLMNYSQQTLSDKVRLGEEPMSNTMLGFDGATKLDLPFVTGALNFIPGFYTREMSQFSVKTDAAYMMPNPNTASSPIQSDGGQGVAYIDDFEGMKQTIPLGIGYSTWHYASPPRYIMNLDPDPDSSGIINTDLSIPDTLKPYYKGKLYWYNELPSPINVTDIWPQRQAALDQQQVTALTIHYDPTQRGTFNYSLRPDTTFLKDPGRYDWGGIMKVVSTASTNLIDENINYIEFWMKISAADAAELKKAKMLIDLGRISEDVIPNGILNTEDGVHGKPPNDRLMDDEDVGLDGKTDAEEKVLWPALGDDPSGDDWEYHIGGGYEKVNGTEGNGKSETGRIPDTEDINHNGNLDVINSYFEYEVPLDTTGGINSKTNPFIVGGGLSSDPAKLWYQFRIPLIKPTREVGSPSLETVQFIRLWFAGSAKPVEVQLVDLQLTGSQWIETRKNDSTMTVSSVSVEETPGYVSPPGVVRERDKTKPNENVLANEQSLVLKVRGLRPGDSRSAIKYYTYRPLDIFSYRTLKMFVRSDPNLRYIDSTHADARFFMRFGLDTLNYYEYSAPLRPPTGFDENGQWTNNIEIDFTELTGIKQKRDSISQIIYVRTRNGPPGSYYSVRGQPTLTQIKMMMMGVSNDSTNASPISGDVWADELRVTNVDATHGWAVRAESQLKLADLSVTSFSISRIDPYFHSIDQRFGSRSTNMNWSLDSRWTFERFLPRSWTGSSMTVSYTHTEQLSTPLYLPGTDVLTTEAAQRTSERIFEETNSAAAAQAVKDSIINASQTMFISDTWAAPTVKVNIPSRSWYIQDLINRISLGFSYTKSNTRSPAVYSQHTWSWNATAAYNLSFAPENSYSPFKSVFDKLPVLDFIKAWRFYYTPQTFSMSMAAARGRSDELLRGLYGLKPIQRNFTANRALGFLWKFTEGGIINPAFDYSLNVTSSLVHLETDTAGNQRPFSAILKDIFGKDRLIDFGLDNGYDQRVTLTTKPRVPTFFSLDKYIDLQGGYSSGYHWAYSFQQGDLGKTTSVGTSMNLTSTLRLKQMSDNWFPKSEPAPARRDTTKQENEGPGITLSQFLKYAVKTPFLEYENINLSFTQTNSAQNSGVPGGPGFLNFWGVAPFQQPNPEDGASRIYQLGLISAPTDRLMNFRIRPTFPFFGFDRVPGLRAPDGVLTDNFLQTNRLSFTTSRELWKGARMDLKWNVGWSYNRNVNLTTDSTGQTIMTNTMITRDVERSYFTMPQVLFFRPFKSGVDEVGRLYGEMAADTSISVGEKLAKAFEQGFETMPFLSKILGNLVPRLNYTFRWDGLEKLPLLNSIASRVSFDHAYQATFTRRWATDPSGSGLATQSERVAYGYQPLANLTIQFKEFWKGSLSGNVKYSTSTTYDLNIATTTVLEGATSDMAVSMNYSRRGFEIPLFGLSLSNDLDVSLSYTYSKNSQKTYTPDQLATSGTPYEGSTRTILEPRIKYVLSMRVTASMYYRKTSIQPDQGSRTVGQSTSEFGFDIKLSIGQ